MHGVSSIPLSLRLFREYDTDNSGGLDGSEFKNLCYSKGYYLGDEELVAAMHSIGENGTITYENFKEWWRNDSRFDSLRLDEHAQAQLQQAINYFKYFDRDQSGTIDAGEFKALHADLKRNNLVTSSLKECWKTINLNDDGNIALEEFVDWMIKNGSLTLHQKSRREQEVERHTNDKKRQQAEEAQLLRDAITYFQYFDKDSSGAIDRKEFQRLHADLTSNGMLTCPLAQAFQTLDADNDGEVTFTEYVAWLTRDKVLTRGDGAAPVDPMMQEMQKESAARSNPKVDQEKVKETTAPSSSPQHSGGEGRFYTYEELKMPASTIDKGQIDVTRRELYLSDKEFMKVLGFSKEEWGKLSNWKKEKQKKAVGLY